jgi:PAS domain S-box-containing protein
VERGSRLTGQTGPVRDEAIRAELEQLRRQIAELQQTKRRLEDELQESASAAASPITTSAELESTLRRFMQKVAMIVRGEKTVLMLYNQETGGLEAQWPALGLTREEVDIFRVPAAQGISGQVFREGRAVIVDDAMTDPRTVKENVALLSMRNALTVPLMVERKDSDGKVVERTSIGVFHVFNKRGGQRFTEEDITLLNALARNAAAVISSAKLYISVANEKRELEATLQGMLSGVLVADGQGKVRLMNSAARHIFGAPREEVSGRPLSQVIHNEEVTELIHACLSGSSEANAEISIFNPEERIYQVQTALLQGENDAAAGVVTTLNDITEIRSVERMKTEFVSTVSHELRTPLTSIKGFIRTLLDDTDGYYEREMQMEFYRIIDTECDRLVRLISDLLNLSRIESGRSLDLVLTEVDLGKTVERVVDSQRSYASGHEFEVVVPADLPIIAADQDKVEQVLTNLLSNAVKYSPEGGKVMVLATRLDEHVSVSVSDQGIGIPEEHLGKLFTRFHRVDNRDTRKQYGTGIGLYLVKHLVEAHHGEIKVESTVGEGSTFTFVLPIRQPGEEQPGVKAGTAGDRESGMTAGDRGSGMTAGDRGSGIGNRNGHGRRDRDVQ